MVQAMRFGCCANMVARRPDGIGAEVAETLAAAGYDYIELSLSHMTALSAAEFKALLQWVNAAGITCEACNNFFPSTVRLTGTEYDSTAVAAYAERALDRAAAAGASVVVLGSGAAKNVPAGYPHADAWKQLIDILQTVAPMAACRGIAIALEPLRTEECNIINTIDEAAALARASSQENAGVLADLFHMDAMRDSVESITRAGSLLRHVHFSNPRGRVFPGNPAEYDYIPFIRALSQTGYCGRMSIEAYSEDLDTDARRALAVLKQVCTEARAFSRLPPQTLS